MTLSDEKVAQVREALEYACRALAPVAHHGCLSEGGEQDGNWADVEYAHQKLTAALRILQREGEAEAVTTHEHLTVTVRAQDIMEAHRTARQVAAFLRQRNPTPTATEREAPKPKRVLVVDDGLDHALRKVLAAEAATEREVPERECQKCGHPADAHVPTGCSTCALDDHRFGGWGDPLCSWDGATEREEG